MKLIIHRKRKLALLWKAEPGKVSNPMEHYQTNLPKWKAAHDVIHAPLTDSHKSTVSKFFGGEHERINNALGGRSSVKGMTHALGKGTEEHFRNLKEVFHRSAAPTDTHAYVSMHPSHPLHAHLENAGVGSVVHTSEHLVGTMNPSHARAGEGHSLVHVEVPKGSSAISHHDSGGDHIATQRQGIYQYKGRSVVKQNGVGVTMHHIKYVSHAARGEDMLKSLRLTLTKPKMRQHVVQAARTIKTFDDLLDVHKDEIEHHKAHGTKFEHSQIDHLVSLAKVLGIKVPEHHKYLRKVVTKTGKVSYRYEGKW